MLSQKGIENLKYLTGGIERAMKYKFIEGNEIPEFKEKKDRTVYVTRQGQFKQKQEREVKSKVPRKDILK